MSQPTVRRVILAICAAAAVSGFINPADACPTGFSDCSQGCCIGAPPKPSRSPPRRAEAVRRLHSHPDQAAR